MTVKTSDIEFVFLVSRREDHRLVFLIPIWGNLSLRCRGTLPRIPDY